MIRGSGLLFGGHPLEAVDPPHICWAPQHHAINNDHILCLQSLLKFLAEVRRKAVLLTWSNNRKRLVAARGARMFRMVKKESVKVSYSVTFEPFGNGFAAACCCCTVVLVVFLNS